MTARQRSAAGQSTRARLFQVAAELFRAKGFAATTTREIADVAGIRKATLYHHIRRKEDLLYELCIAALDHINAVAHEVLSQEEAPAKKLRTMIEAHVATVLGERDQHAAMLTELRSLTPEARAEVLTRRKAYERRIDEVIQAAQEAGEMRCDVDSKDLRLALLNMLNWTIFWFRPEGEHSPEELGRLYADIFLAGTRNVGRSAGEGALAARKAIT
jgi:AcrR family transcriptional regulator